MLALAQVLCEPFAGTHDDRCQRSANCNQLLDIVLAVSSSVPLGLGKRHVLMLRWPCRREDPSKLHGSVGEVTVSRGG